MGIDQHDASGALVVEGVTIQDQAMSTITSLGMSGDLTNSAGNILMTSTSAQAITHTGASNAHLTISSTNGQVCIESICHAGSAITSSVAASITSTGSTVSVEDVAFTSNAMDHATDSSTA